MEPAKIDIGEIHWMMDMLQSIDAGLIVLDRDYRITLWNGFMANHSGLGAHQVTSRSLFELFPDIPRDWFSRKAESVFLLKNRSYIDWEQRPYLFRFKSYRPITGEAEFMYQNTTLIPLQSTDGQVNHIGIIVYDVTSIATSTRKLEAANGQLAALSRTDRLTGLYNRGYWEECLRDELRRVQRTSQTATLVMFDIDHFKKINDTHGHPAGDEVIRRTAAAVRESIRTTDIAGRYGGEEFALILIDTGLEGAYTVAERLRASIEASTVEHGGNSIRYTISLGVAEVGPDIKSAHDWISCADGALYQAKRSGRNRSMRHVTQKIA